MAPDVDNSVIPQRNISIPEAARPTGRSKRSEGIRTAAEPTFTRYLLLHLLGGLSPNPSYGSGFLFVRPESGREACSGWSSLLRSAIRGLVRHPRSGRPSPARSAIVCAFTEASRPKETF